ncbi:MAG TPA: plastocyanin/azurin family copper-binding protein [Gemmatimonadaceae bacterium]|nr:plastocyanin/azurin family copper-binding protein [Gemmatimonadaceae bacterium]
MRFYGLTLVASALVLGACAGGEKNQADTTGAAGAAPAADTGAAAAPAAGAPAAGGAAQAATGTTHKVNMVIEGTAYKFVPADITVKQGDAIEFINVSGGPHNVCFKPEDVPDDVENQLDANMPATAGSMPKMGKMCGPLVSQPNETYTISFAGIKAGKYPMHCTPHEALGMKGTITVQ